MVNIDVREEGITGEGKMLYLVGVDTMVLPLCRSGYAALSGGRDVLTYY